MLKLLQNEFVKIFKKKSIFVIFVIMIFFVVATNIIYKYKINELGEFNNNKYNYLKIAEYEYENSNDDKVKSLSKFVLDTKYNINRKNDLLNNIPQLNLWLEFGVSQKTHLSLLALGLSRNTVIELTKYITSTERSKEECLNWLRSLNLDELDMSPIIVEDIRRII